LTVADDGQGIAQDQLERAVSEHHIGVASVIERVRGLDGDVRITTAPGAGTSFSISLPRIANQRPAAPTSP
jgi:signal transduction histidine kinase